MMYGNYPTRPVYYYYYYPPPPPSSSSSTPPSVKEIPVNRPVRKVVSVPVQDAGSERKKSASEVDSAVRIQKVFRGFLVRKSVRKIAAIRDEVNEIERRISENETVELTKKIDSKERLKVTETLMSLLLRLDSVHGVDSAVRELRKAVISKAIALQEMLDDAMVAADEPRAESQAESFESHESLAAGDQGAEDKQDTEEKERKSREALERMMEENEKMVGLMVDLFERNELQTRLLNCLSQRVERLERAFIYDKLRREKKRNATAGFVDSSESKKKSGTRDSQVSLLL